jgi:hypothetical protein
MKLKWNLAGRTSLGQSKDPPPKYLDFLRSKRMEYVMLIVQSCVLVALFVSGLEYFKNGDNVLAETMKSSATIIVVSLLIGMVL